MTVEDLRNSVGKFNVEIKHEEEDDYLQALKAMHESVQVCVLFRQMVPAFCQSDIGIVRGTGYWRQMTTTRSPTETVSPGWTCTTPIRKKTHLGPGLGSRSRLPGWFFCMD